MNTYKESAQPFPLLPARGGQPAPSRRNRRRDRPKHSTENIGRKSAVESDIDKLLETLSGWQKPNRWHVG